MILFAMVAISVPMLGGRSFLRRMLKHRSIARQRVATDIGRRTNHTMRPPAMIN